MRKSTLAWATGMLLTCLPAYAAQITGTIIALDDLGQQLVLGDGSIYSLPRWLGAATLVLGSKVKVTYTSAGNTNRATAVVRAR
jgi:hypothetical protein